MYYCTNMSLQHLYMSMLIMVVRVVTSCEPVSGFQRFGETYRIHLQGVYNYFVGIYPLHKRTLFKITVFLKVALISSSSDRCEHKTVYAALPAC
jgi:hypothetical protein